ncbi:hypothetical protein OEV98_02195 [Caldibacillus lycopersici]|uniref:HMA domain-containing protein n=1 Tax=Perspicuibacillus lycopersici TaxID=1325689 RepID=A0AAE3LM58_9BACI|nr:hypothetical protein [Perspicuibacillus lycopersici]MCU9612372.1 hypothetical protein [Perspicuibacillus lycopersici]
MAETTIYVQNPPTHTNIQQMEDILLKLDGTIRVLVDTQDGEVKIEYDESKVTVDDLTAALESEHYQIKG